MDDIIEEEEELEAEDNGNGNGKEQVIAHLPNHDVPLYQRLWLLLRRQTRRRGNNVVSTRSRRRCRQEQHEMQQQQQQRRRSSAAAHKDRIEVIGVVVIYPILLIILLLYLIDQHQHQHLDPLLDRQLVNDNHNTSNKLLRLMIQYYTEGWFESTTVGSIDTCVLMVSRGINPIVAEDKVTKSSNIA